MAFGNGMGSPEELAMKLKELAGQMRPQQTDPVNIGMNVDNRGGLTMQPPPGTPKGTPGPFHGYDPENRYGTSQGGIAKSAPYNPSPVPSRGGPSSNAGPGGQPMYMVNGNDGPKHIPRSMVEQWINGNEATRKKIESMNPANR